MGNRDTERRLVGLVQRFLYVAVGAIVVAAVLSTLNLSGSSPNRQAGLPADPQPLRPSTHRLSATPTDRVALVGFLDFECSACGVLYPYIDQLRDLYAGELTIAIRNFPESQNRGAVEAAAVVDAAAHQGKQGEMAWKLFETQYEWAGASGPKRRAFVAAARDLGLDVRRFRADLRDPRTRQKVEFDRREGLALGVEAAPTLFLDGKPYPLPETFVQMREEIEAALEE